MTRPIGKLVAYDHIVESDIEIWGADPCAAGIDRPVDIRVVSCPALNAPIADPEIYRWDGETLDFLPPGVGRYRCRGGETIEVAAEPDADPEAVQALLIATALPALLWMRGAFVLHAAAVMLPDSDRAIVVAGPSGIGKSTILEQLMARGARLIADDTVRVSLSDDGVSVSGLPSGYFIRGDAIDERRFQPVPETARCHRAPLGALFFLSRGSEPGAITALSGVGTIEQLLANRHRPKVPDILGRQVNGLRDCTQIVHRVPAYHWQRRENAPLLTLSEWEALAFSVSGGT